MSKISEDVEFDMTPLAERMRAKNLNEFIGQAHIVGKDSLIRRALQVNRLGSCIFYGPPGVGKTTLAYIVAVLVLYFLVQHYHQQIYNLEEYPFSYQ